MSNDKIIKVLGTPDFCAEPEDRADRHLLHCAYYFFRYQPPSAKDLPNGFTQITITAGGGWALEMDIVQGLVETAYWRKQE
jgi:hypothetical protein